ALRISATGRGPGRGSTAIRSQATPPSTKGVPSASHVRATASAPTTSPPPPIPSTSAFRACCTVGRRWLGPAAEAGFTTSARTSRTPRCWPESGTLGRAGGARWCRGRSGGCRRRCSASGRDRRALGLGADRPDLGCGPLELLVRHHRRPLEGKVAVDLHPRAAPVVLVTHAHGYRARNPVHPEQQHVKRVPALPAQALVG